MTSREQFEHQCRNGLVNGGLAVFENGVYVSELTRAVWSGWQASRAAVEIKLPNQACLATWHYAGSPPDDFYEDIEISRNPSKDKSVDGTEPFPLLTKWEVEQAIESAGLKVKGD
ncbi:hypothetical protein AB3H13_26910 [Escherichia coli]|uniref:hypothetical protein n=1 Tax=Escherichia coli TaxID=562 RepID=UPI00346520A0|nr:hypothetical protein [Escherichia coli]HCI0273584.1 hypothetical protein [Escherichia coli]HCI3360047.1 hypothetical protein [Escherichia coli]HCI3410989.1 hypothetical protein [Escherichia coli]HCI3685505.1 hypothetical protein [Escherichia coli]